MIGRANRKQTGGAAGKFATIDPLHVEPETGMLDSLQIAEILDQITQMSGG